MKRNTIQALTAVLATALCAIALNGCTSANAATAEEPPTFRLEVTDLPQPDEPVGFAAVDPARVVPLGSGEEPQPELEAEWAEPYYEPAYYESGVGNGYGNPFESAGVVYQDGTRYTWYTGPSSYDDGLTVDSEGFYRDSEGYYVVASSDHDYGTVVDTPWGEGRVYDTGCASGTLDMYTDF